MLLEDALRLDIGKDTLARFWPARHFLMMHPDLETTGVSLRESLLGIVRPVTVEGDHIVKSIRVLCNCEENDCYSSWYMDTDYRDDLVVYMAKKFNRLTNSKRKVFKCYDCGTVARAMFMKIIDDFRGIETLTGDEIAEIDKYRRRNTALKEWYRVVTEGCPDDSRRIMITSQGFGKVGHVWLMEITGRKSAGNLKVRLFQSAKWAYTLGDYLKESCPDGKCYIDFEKFYSEIVALNAKELDSEQIAALIAKWFRFSFEKKEFERSFRMLFCSVVVPFVPRWELD